MAFGCGLWQHTVRRVHHDDGVGTALALVDQHRLSKQGNQGALTVAHDGDGFIRRYTADLTDQHGQTRCCEHKVTPVWPFSHVLGVGQRDLCEMPDSLGKALAVHLQQVVGGIGEEPAALGEVPVQAVFEHVLILVAQFGRVVIFIALYLARLGAIAPIKRDHQAAGFGVVRVSLIKERVWIVECGFVIFTELLNRDFFCSIVVRPIPPRLKIRPIQTLIHPLAQPRLHRLV